MKKIILSIALIAGVFTTTAVQASTQVIEKPIIEITSDDDGFVNIKFEELSEKVQEAVRALVQNYDLNALKLNAEKQLTKVEATKKEDQTQKVFYFDAEGNEVVLESAQEEEEEETVTQEQEEIPSPEISSYSAVKGDDGFVEVKLEDLNEKVQAAISALAEMYDIDAIFYNAEKQVTKVKVTSKEDQVEKKIYFDNEGAETTWEEPVESVEQESNSEEVL